MSDRKLEETVPVERELIINGEKLVIKNLKFGQYLKCKAALNRIILALSNTYIKAESVAEVRKHIFELEADIFDAIGGREDEVYLLLEVSTGKSREWLESLSIKDGASLFTSVLGVNADFFRQGSMLRPSLKDREINGNGKGKTNKAQKKKGKAKKK